ncbi:lantibiotic dehydratase C-terminal domain-containing protein [Lactococcus lactis]|uniref:lantibiotic dehydratase C-terminal domain-containing protein n=1 Tax=Lactococcus lactis TaxID=1358 RepID=UPI0022E7A34D|nr:lantibiotic dehydratase C-terminal domain-containing protein [Lactococcus lactis]
MEYNNNWLSYHIFCHNYSIHDKIICKLTNWAIEENIKDYFFIRYWEGGPHIRFRIKKNDYLKDYYKIALQNLLSEELENNVVSITKEQYYRGNKLDGKKIPIQELPWFDNNSIISIDYIRENDRYGGKEFIEEAENLFNKSSILVFLLLKEHNNCKLTIRVFFYLYIYKAVIEKIEYNELDFDQMQFYTTCFKYWKTLYELENTSYITNLTNSISNSFDSNIENINKVFMFISKSKVEEFSKPLIIYLKKVGYLKGKKMMRSVLFSQMHMFANRLGIPIEYECGIYGYLKKTDNLFNRGK